MRDLELWNIVCDAIVNANLKRDGIKIPDGRICSDTDEKYGDWVLEYSSEELYELEKRKKEEQKNNQNQEQGESEEQEQDNQQGSGQSQQQEDEQNSNNENSEQTENQESDNNKSQGDDHSLWEEAFKEQQKGQKQAQEQDQEQAEEEQTDIDFDERAEFEDNRKEKREKFKSRKEKTEKDIRNTDKGKIELGDIGKSKEEIDWKLLIRKEIEKSETIWSQRRSIAENNYAYRLEENDIEEDAETEVMIDASGSVDLELVKSFLRQLKPLLQHSKLKVGCFNAKFWGFVNIKNEKDINNFTVPRWGAYATDLDLPVRSFTKKREINKIIFTDGYASFGLMPKEDLKRENVIWLVYGNKDFKPCCGKVINITEKQLERLHQIDRSSSMEDMSR